MADWCSVGSVGQESSTSGIRCLMIWGGSDVIVIKCRINIMCLNYTETIPHPRSMKKRSSMKPVPGARKVGDCCCRALHSPGSMWMSLSPSVFFPSLLWLSFSLSLLVPYLFPLFCLSLTFSKYSFPFTNQRSTEAMRQTWVLKGLSWDVISLCSADMCVCVCLLIVSCHVEEKRSWSIFLAGCGPSYPLND